MSTLGWPRRTKELETFYPTSVLVTGFDIIFFWVARMVDARPALHRRGAVPRGVHPRPDPRPRRPEDVEVEGQRPRPARHRRRHRPRGAGREAHDRPHAAAARPRDRARDPQAVPAGHRGLRHGCAALHFRLARDAVARPALRPRPRRGLPQLLQQALERGALRADVHRVAAAEPGAETLSPYDRWIRSRLGGDRRRRARGFAGLPLRPRRPGRLRVHLVRVLRLVPRVREARAAVGGRATPHSAGARAARCSRRWRRCCGCCIR